MNNGLFTKIKPIPHRMEQIFYRNVPTKQLGLFLLHFTLLSH